MLHKEPQNEKGTKTVRILDGNQDGCGFCVKLKSRVPDSRRAIRPAPIKLPPKMTGYSQ